jgi:hypothetical protein
MGFTRAPRLEAYQKAFEKGSKNKNTEAQRAQRGWKIQKNSVTSVPLCSNWISLCILGGMGFPWVFRVEAFSKGF